LPEPGLFLIHLVRWKRLSELSLLAILVALSLFLLELRSDRVASGFDRRNGTDALLC
jgi:hypothetical protein